MSTQETPERPRRHRRLTVVSVAAAVLLAGGGGAYWASSAADDGAGGPASGGGSGPPPLTLDGLGQEEAGGGREPGIAPGEPDPNGVFYRAGGPLPDGPERAAVHRPAGGVTAEKVRAVAEALDVAGEPVHRHGRWRVGGHRDGSGPTLTVGAEQAAGSWSFVRYAPASDDKCGKPDGRSRTLPAPCPGGPVGGPGASGGDPVPAAEAKRQVRPVLRALGLGGARLDASATQGALRTVVARPEVAGVPTHDWSSTFTVAGDGRLVRGHGRLGALTRGAEYPVLPAADTLRELNERRGPVGQLPPCSAAPPAAGEPHPERPEGSDVAPCRQTGPDGTATVTGATFALATQYSRGEPVLVPSWVFDVRPSGASGGGKTGGRTYQVTFPAVQPEFLRTAGGGPGGGDRDTPTGAPAGPGIPHGPETPADARRPLVSYAADGRTLTLTFWGGVCHPYEARTEETAERVRVAVRRVPEKSGKPEEPCIAMAKKQTVRAELERPLGDRAVVHARSGKPVPRTE
ncbi:hypothetical protein [Streptomyces sp. JJ36]|uniref:hypothetical protein n=1 Tax=Streptomyces sp. JJ36 TaxID=2736645 RepID=UPI001F472A19|nr:hypothetical protein [Streptomyces sp. JJ36]MCF6522955.1 hypothetical protein [Streptomyces sp. JJ36]